MFTLEGTYMVMMEEGADGAKVSRCCPVLPPACLEGTTHCPLQFKALLFFLPLDDRESFWKSTTLCGFPASPSQLRELS